MSKDPASNLYLHHHHQGRLCRVTTFLESRMTVLEKEDWRSVISLVTNAKRVVTLVQDVASKVAGYAKFRSATGSSGTKKLSLVSRVLPVRPGGNSAPWHQL